MASTIDDVTKRRLIYVKKLYLHGHEHIPYQTEFDRMIAIHHFDNAVELLLKCAVSRLGVAPKRPLHLSFPNLWNLVDEKVPLPKKTEMFQLHKFRSDVQHWGVSPFSTEVVNRFDVYVSDFLREVMKDVFGLDFEELFISSLVEDKTFRKILTIAEKAFEKGDYEKSMRFADAAFNRALGQQRETFGLPTVSLDEDEKFEFLIDRVFILQLGIDYLRYANYTRLRTYWDEEEENIYYARPLWKEFGGKEDKKRKDKRFTREKALLNLNFVLDCILRWHM